jgi:succinate dehydrogenase subunit C
MSSQTLAVSRPSLRTAAYLDFIQMLTGIGLILFIYGHSILMASIDLGPATMNRMAKFLEDSYMAQVGGPLIAVIFLLHFVLAARKIPFRSQEQRVMLDHSRRLHHLDTWLWVIQAVTAMIILIMGSIHIWTVLTTLPISAAKSATRVQGESWLIFYIILNPLIQLHVGIGLYRIGVKWGVVTRANRTFYKLFVTILTLIFISLGAFTLASFYKLIL